jgi:DNA polymerase III delta prime subunit
MTYKLTIEQEKIYEEITRYIREEDERNEVILIGYAGTGKTTLITKLINEVIEDKERYKNIRKIGIVAPTHKAVNIAKSKLFEGKENISKNIDIMTVHRLLNYKGYINESGEKYFGKSKVEPNLSKYNIIVIDECSMLSNQIIRDINSEIKKEKNKKVKIIYVGDPAQLPPVNQRDSEIFKKNITRLNLDKVVRTNNNYILELSTQQRQWVISRKEEDMPRILKYRSEDVKIYMRENKKKWLEDFINNGDDSNIILTWTNRACNEYNNYVRNRIFKKENLEIYEKGEILIFNDYHRIIRKTEDKKEIISFYTSEQIKLEEFSRDTYKMEDLKTTRIKNMNIDLGLMIARNILKINELLRENIKIFKLRIQKINKIEKDKEPEIYEIKMIDNEERNKYNKINEDFDIIMNELREKAYKFVNKMKIEEMEKMEQHDLVDKRIMKIWKDWHENVIDVFGDINYGYSITVHKSQGSTFRNVYLDMNDIMDNKNEDEVLKCLYTGITRTSKRLVIMI